MIDIDVKAEVDEVVRALGRLDGEVDKAAARAINKAVEKGRTDSKRVVAREIGLSRISDSLKYLRFKFAKTNSLSGEVRAPYGKAARVSVKHLKVKSAKGSRVSWKAGSTRMNVDNSFQGKGKLNGHFYHRYNPDSPYAKGRRKIVKLTSRSAGDAIGEITRSKEIQGAMVGKFHYEFSRQINRALTKLGIRK
jgi:hypothetical protein